ncbi:hypothetical protein B0H13DRAFT_2279884 [Mycena leptocephala]|nr:hypothetical protein B0H13DRAFT_2279884 [Mycena leptocephala]
MLPRCAASPFPRPLPRHRVVAVKPALSRVRSQGHSHIPFLLLRPSSSIALLSCLSFSTLREYSSASPSYARRSHSRSAVTVTFPPPPRHTSVRIIKSADQQASIFLHQKLKVGSSTALPLLFPLSPSLPFLLPSPTSTNAAGPEERAIRARGGKMIMHRAVSKLPWALRNTVRSSRACATASSTSPRTAASSEASRGHSTARRRMFDCVGAASGRSDDDAGEQTCVARVDSRGPHRRRRSSRSTSYLHLLSDSSPSSPSGNKSLKGKWTALACYETESLVVQHAFENVEESAKDGIVDELLGQVGTVFGEVAKSYPRTRVGEASPNGARATPHWPARVRDELAGQQERGQGTQGGREGDVRPRRAAHVRAGADKDQCAVLYDCICGHAARLQDRLEGYLALFLFCLLSCVFSIDRMRAYYGH